MNKKTMPEYTEELNEKIAAYYRKMYSWVGLKDIEQRVEVRLREDNAELVRCGRIEKILSMRMADYADHLVVGAGTGGLIAALKFKGVKDVYAVEPFREAFLIARQKAELSGVDPSHITEDFAEKLPYPDSSMDMVHCFTVLEHVQDVRKAVSEMYRVLRPGGLIYIHTPDYRNIFEGHYKLYLPLFLGKTVTKALLKLYGRPTEFLDTIRFITEKKIDRILRQEVGHYMRIYGRMPAEWGLMPDDPLKKRIYKRLVKFFYLNLAIPTHQEIVIKKTE